MAVQVHQIVEVDCPPQPLTPQEILAFLPQGSIRDTEGLRELIDLHSEECACALHPRGVYKLFNPATCTLPPAYTEPGIKLVGTMAVLRGKAVYERMRKATHCVMVAATPGHPEEIEGLRDRMCRTDEDEVVMDACLAALGERALESACAAVTDEAVKLGLYTDDALVPNGQDFPLETNSQLLFYTQAEKRLGLRCAKDGAVAPKDGTLCVVGMYDKSQKNRKRACARCKNRDKCSIRAIGMNCHGRRGTFAS